LRCPGRDSRFLKIELVKCKNCGYEVEVFSDELKVKCPKCKKDVFREKLPSCLDWCKYAQLCLGKVVNKKVVGSLKKRRKLR